MSDIVFRLAASPCMHSSIMREAAGKIITLSELSAQLYQALRIVNSDDPYNEELLTEALEAYEKVFHGE